MRTLTRVLRVAACGFVLLGSTSVRAAAQLSPPSGTLAAAPEADQPAAMIGGGYFQLSMAGGEQHSVRLIVKNDSRQPMTIRAYPVDGVPTSGGGGIDFTTFDQPVANAGTWVALDTSDLLLAPGESRRVTASITVPAYATPGDHVAGLAIEDAVSHPSDTDSQVVITVFYRRAIAIVVAVPGERTTALEVEAVALSQDVQGNRAVVQLRNTGNSLLKAKGTLEIGGSPVSDLPQAFSIDTLIPSAAAGVVVRLPGARLAPGPYNAHVVVNAEDGHSLADWQGIGAMVVGEQPQPTPLPTTEVTSTPGAPPSVATLSDRDTAAITRQAATTDSTGFWLLGIATLALALRLVFVRVVRRRG